MHFQLDLNKRKGQLKVDLKELTAGQGVYKKLKETRQKIQGEYPADYLLKNLYEPKHRALVKHLGVFVDHIRDVIKSIYFTGHEAPDLAHTTSGDFSSIKSRGLETTSYDRESMEVLLSSQAFQMYLEKTFTSPPPPTV